MWFWFCWLLWWLFCLVCCFFLWFCCWFLLVFWCFLLGLGNGCFYGFLVIIGGLVSWWWVVWKFGWCFCWYCWMVVGLGVWLFCFRSLCSCGNIIVWVWLLGVVGLCCWFCCFCLGFSCCEGCCWLGWCFGLWSIVGSFVGCRILGLCSWCWWIDWFVVLGVGWSDIWVGFVFVCVVFGRLCWLGICCVVFGVFGLLGFCLVDSWMVVWVDGWNVCLGYFVWCCCWYSVVISW